MSSLKTVTSPKSRKVKSRKPSSSTTRKVQRKTVSSKKKRWEVPVWLYYILMGMMTIFFIAAFYYFFIRPYAYRWKPCYGLKGYGVCMPHGYKIHGIDISHYQGEIDWKMLRQTHQSQFPIRFVFMKATEGGDYADDKFIANFDSARSNGFIRAVKLEKGDLPPVLDIEKKSKNMDKLRSDLKLWLQRVEDYYGVKPIIYASYKFKTRYLNDSFFNSYPYWIAHYYVDSVEYKGDWVFWQHHDAGTLPGINEQVDLNIFNGTIQQLSSLCIK